MWPQDDEKRPPCGPKAFPRLRSRANAVSKARPRNQRRRPHFLPPCARSPRRPPRCRPHRRTGPRWRVSPRRGAAKSCTRTQAQARCRQRPNAARIQAPSDDRSARCSSLGVLSRGARQSSRSSPPLPDLSWRSRFLSPLDCTIDNSAAREVSRPAPKDKDGSRLQARQRLRIRRSRSPCSGCRIERIRPNAACSSTILRVGVRSDVRAD